MTTQNIYDLADTWNAGATTFTAIKMNVTDTASAAASLLMDLQVDGASRFRVSKAGATTVSSLLFPGSSSGTVTIQPAAAAGTYTLTLPTDDGNAGQALLTDGSGVLSWGAVGGTPGGSNTQLQFNNSGAFGGASGLTTNGTDLTLGSSSQLLWSTDLILTRRGAANLQLGAATAAGSSITVSSVDTTAETVTLSSAHGLSSGAAVQFTTTTTLPGGITAGTTYYVRVTSTTAFELYDTYGNATAASGTTGRINITSAGTGTHTCNFGLPFQQLSVQSFTGTNIPGQPFVITGSQGTGTGAGGSIIFQVAPAGSSGTAQNALTTALTINSNGSVLIATPNTNNSTLLTNGSYGLNFRNATNTAAQEIQCQRVTIEGTGYYWFVTRGLITSSANGVVHVQNSQTNDATAQQLAFGPSTSSTNGCRIKHAAGGTSLQVRNGNDTDDADLTAKALTLSGDLTISTKDIVTDTTTGTKIGTATTQKIGFFNAAPVVQPTAVADATDAATVITQLNALLSRMRDLGLIAT